jgi:sugar phosphate isomerase/epimerase
MFGFKYPMMTPRRTILSLAGLPFCASGQRRFSPKLGLQLYSLRREAAKDLPATLALVRQMGFSKLEVGAFYGRTAAEFRGLLDSLGLTAVAYGSDWNRLNTNPAQVAEEARTVGASYVTASQIPRKKRLTLDDATGAAETFNRWGKTLSASGLRFCYHIHGYEFVEGPDGTLFDTLAKQTDPSLAAFEMDVFWVVFGNEDPARLLERYSGRFPLMHVKDIRKGEARTFNPGTVAEEASVPLGAGEVDWVSTLRAAEKHGVKEYFLEEEHPNAVAQMRQSLRYLETLRL